MVQTQTDEVLVAAARDGDRAAVEALAARYLPLVYTVVGRGADRDLDVDDIVQDTMMRVVTGVSGVRQAERFRSWVVTIALRQLADARAEARRSRLSRADDPAGDDREDPAADFVGLTVLRQVLDTEQREIAEAARWLDPAFRVVLSLWWLEAGGHLTRAEVAEALELSAAHAGVRVQRMREQLDVARSVVRALDAAPGCPALRDTTSGWDGELDPLWRKRIARHVRDCPRCSERSRRLAAAEGLLAGLPLLAPPAPHQPRRRRPGQLRCGGQGGEERRHACRLRRDGLRGRGRSEPAGAGRLLRTGRAGAGTA
ncbi:sigma-70 family RNA polymerase sigma factor [Dactylosporangium cerinum]|uniref:Sigma-70 family RNA polymerase sigma factor n=1 Tax=Dactylosporangium cerinum TaxID=1434730 RepID=A0ABV9WKK9_9ACTN